MTDLRHQYDLHMLSFKRKGENGFNVAYASGGNLQPWHMALVRAWLDQQESAGILGATNAEESIL